MNSKIKELTYQANDLTARIRELPTTGVIEVEQARAIVEKLLLVLREAVRMARRETALSNRLISDRDRLQGENLLLFEHMISLKSKNDELVSKGRWESVELAMKLNGIQ